LIEKILKKGFREEELKKSEILTLLSVKKPEEIKGVMDTACAIRDERKQYISLTSTVHITNICKVVPKCKYCGFAAGTSHSGYYHPFYKTEDEILKIVNIINESGIPRVSCSGAHGYNGTQAVQAARIVKKNTSLDLLINVGSDLKPEALNDLVECGVDTICCNLETTNNLVFKNAKPGEELKDRINVCNMVSDSGIELSSGLLIGLGESYEDRIGHLKFLNSFNGLGEIPIMGFNPYKGTPMQDYPPCSLQDQMLTVAVTRILYPDIRITVPTPTIGPENAKYSLMAGADNLATVIPDKYPMEIKGVGSPGFGTLNEVISVIKEMGLKPAYNSHTNPIGQKIPVVS
jgi:biotin synthase